MRRDEGGEIQRKKTQKGDRGIDRKKKEGGQKKRLAEFGLETRDKRRDKRRDMMIQIRKRKNRIR